MKKQLFSAISKLTLSVVLIAGVAVAQAQTNGIAPNEKTAEIKYIGTSSEGVVFNVAFDNPTGNKFAVIVRDQDGGSVYQEMFSDKKFDKKFRLPKNTFDKLTFIIRTYKDNDLVQSFEINTNTHTVEDVEVKKVG